MGPWNVIILSGFQCSSTYIGNKQQCGGEKYVNDVTMYSESRLMLSLVNVITC